MLLCCGLGFQQQHGVVKTPLDVAGASIRAAAASKRIKLREVQRHCYNSSGSSSIGRVTADVEPAVLAHKKTTATRTHDACWGV